MYHCQYIQASNSAICLQASKLCLSKPEVNLCYGEQVFNQLQLLVFYVNIKRTTRFEFYDFFVSKHTFIALESVGLDVLFMNCLHVTSEAAFIYEFFPTNCTRFSVHCEQEKDRRNRNVKKKSIKL